MSSNVTAEEARALAESNVTEPEITTAQILVRDFRSPRRMAPAQLAKLARAAARSTHEIEASLRVWLRAEYKAEIESVSEVHATELLRELESPLCLIAFECAGRPCWALWDLAMASAATEIALGTTQVEEPKARALSTVEQGVLRNMLGRAIALVAQSLDVAVQNIRFVPDQTQLDLERADAKEGDPQRLAVHIALSGPLGESTLRFYLVGVKAPELVAPNTNAPKDKKKGFPMPEHLADVPFELGAQLGTADIALADLLGLEPGDVIPLTASVGGTLAVYVDGIPCASARFGSHKGKLAIQLQSFVAPDAEAQT